MRRAGVVLGMDDWLSSRAMRVICVASMVSLDACADDLAVTPGVPPAASVSSSPGGATDTEIGAMAARYASLPKMNAAPFRTGQHQGNPQVNVYASTAAEGAYRSVNAGTFTGRFPTGTLLVKEMLDPVGGAPILTVMYKKAPGYDPEHGDYWYGRLAADGTPTRADFVGKVGFCIDCHGGAAKTDRVWGLPSGVR